MPTHIYRYRPLPSENIEKELLTLSEGHVWCSHYANLNDPLEGSFNPSQKLNKRHHVSPLWDEILRESTVGICSFSETNKNIQMWGLYANEGKGICIAYSLERLRTIIGKKCKLLQVEYRDKPPFIALKQATPTKQLRDKALEKIFSRKHVNWQSEREWRIIAPKFGKLFIGHEAISHIFLGARLDHDAKEKVIACARSKFIPCSVMLTSGYDLEFRPC